MILGPELWETGTAIANHMDQLAKHALMFLLRGYKWIISPLLPPACRYVPTCSEYALEAVDRYGALRGSAMAIWRVLRCHPLAKGGVDPVVAHDSSLCSH